MLVKFPQISRMQVDGSALSADNTLFAYYKPSAQAGKRTVFLTEHTLIFVLQGEKHFHFQDQSVTVAPNNLLLLKRGIYVMAEYTERGQNFEALMVFMPDQFLRDFSYGIPDPKPSGETEMRYAIMPSNELLNSFKVQYLSYFGKSFPAMAQILRVKLQELFLILTASPGKESILRFIQSTLHNEPVNLEYVVQSYLFEPLTIDELAHLSGRSLASFKRDFGRIYACPPKQWINQRRLAHARTLLYNTSNTVSEVAFACGFENVSHFIKIFKKEYGTTPSATRAKIAMI